jgi:hypothetical protein
MSIKKKVSIALIATHTQNGEGATLKREGNKNRLYVITQYKHVPQITTTKR